MLVVFEVHFAPGADPDALLSAETLRETQAQIMTADDAAKVGFTGMTPPPEGTEVRLIAVASKDQRWIQRALELSDAVASFRLHDVGA
ncbi:MAG: hypothetical protein WKG00_01220 [Polyangiaceae bacterium]